MLTNCTWKLSPAKLSGAGQESQLPIRAPRGRRGPSVTHPRPVRDLGGGTGNVRFARRGSPATASYTTMVRQCASRWFFTTRTAISAQRACPAAVRAARPASLPPPPAPRPRNPLPPASGSGSSGKPVGPRRSRQLQVPSSTPAQYAPRAPAAAPAAEKGSELTAASFSTVGLITDKEDVDSSWRLRAPSHRPQLHGVPRAGGQFVWTSLRGDAVRISLRTKWKSAHVGVCAGRGPQSTVTTVRQIHLHSSGELWEPASTPIRASLQPCSRWENSPGGRGAA